MAVPVPAAEAETMVTLRELQEALEEEVLTRQSLSRELEAIRTANQNFSRLGSRSWGEGGSSNPCSLLTQWVGLPSYLSTANYRKPRSGTETWRRMFGSYRSGWRCCRPQEPQASPSPVSSQKGAGWRWGTLGV